MSEGYHETAAEYIARRRAYHLEKLIVAAQAVCDQWDSHDGAGDEHIETLRKAIEEAKK